MVKVKVALLTTAQQNNNNNNNIDANHIVSLNIKFITTTEHIHINLELKLMSTIQQLKHKSYQKLLQTHSKNSNIPESDYFDMISVCHPDLFDLFQLFEEDSIIDVISNPINEWIYLYNKTERNIHNFKIFNHNSQNQNNHTNQLNQNKMHFQNCNSNDTLNVAVINKTFIVNNNNNESNNEEKKQVHFFTAPILWHSYQGVKYNSQKNAALARENKIHFTFFGILVYAFKFMGLWNSDIIQKNLKIEMKMHGMTNNDLLDTINFGIKLTQKQISELIATTKWLPSENPLEIESKKDENNDHIMNGNANNEVKKLYNVKLSMCMYLRKAFDGTVPKTMFTFDERKNYLKIFEHIVGLHENEVEYIQKLYKIENDLCEVFHSYL